jgi:hypothetical protein
MPTFSSAPKRKRSTDPRGDSDGGIAFPALEAWDPLNHVASIVAETNDGRVLCTVSADVLDARFTFDLEHPMRAVEENRVVLRSAARKLIEKGAFDAKGRVNISLEDLA